jgi:hypothetical protein
MTAWRASDASPAVLTRAPLQAFVKGVAAMSLGVPQQDVAEVAQRPPPLPLHRPPPRRAEKRRRRGEWRLLTAFANRKVRNTENTLVFRGLRKCEKH